MSVENKKNISGLSSLLRRVGGFDYIITGAGCAGLSLVMHLVRSGKFRHKQILLVDQDAKRTNDRTWCFWEQGEGLFEPIVYKTWEQLWFHAPDFSGKLQLLPYRYKLIRGIDFYDFCLRELAPHPNLHFVQARVDAVHSNERETYAVIEGQKCPAKYIFNSILFEKPRLKRNEYWLQQHFKGWVIETEADAFDAAAATLMDFRVNQERGTTFVYTLPFSPRQALVEYTLFSNTLLPQQEYDLALRHYISRFLGIEQYKICEQEFGVIPMTNYAFPQRRHTILNIGTAGGYTKGSSGYTFRFVQKHVQQIVNSLAAEGHPFATRPAPQRFRFYDSVLLHILHHQTMEGAAIFSQLFRKNKASAVLKFLDNDTALPEEMRIISSLPTGTFLQAAIRHLRG